MEPTTKPLYRVDGVHGLFADAAAWSPETGELFFISLWGRDTAIQELFARLSLPSAQGGFSAFNLTGDGEGAKALVRVSNPGQLAKHSGRMPAANLFGEIVHTWIYTPLVVGPDYAGRRALRIMPADAEEPGQTGGLFGCDAVWSLLKEVSHLPLLEEWREVVVRVGVERDWLKCHAGIGVDAVEIDLGNPEYEAVLGGLIKSGQLRLPGGPCQPSLPDVGGGDGTFDPEPGNDGQRLTSGQLENHLGYFTGTDNWYEHWLVRAMTYTDGVKSFAQHGGRQGAYWFIDVVATEFFPMLKKNPFLHIVLSVKGRQATITVDDGNDRVLREKPVEYTDMQEGNWRFYLTDNVLLLPGEY